MPTRNTDGKIPYLISSMQIRMRKRFRKKTAKFPKCVSYLWNLF